MMTLLVSLWLWRGVDPEGVVFRLLRLEILLWLNTLLAPDLQQQLLRHNENSDSALQVSEAIN